MSKSVFYMLGLSWLLLTACGSDGDGAATEGTGTIAVRVYGEAFIEHGIPAEEVDDGWSIVFDRFEVAVHGVRVAGAALSAEDLPRVDLAVESAGAGHELGRVEVPAGRYHQPSFTIAHVEVVGSAERRGVVKTFDWTFAEPTSYSHCETSTSVEPDGESTFQITVHADHLFYDSLVAEEPRLSFGALAAADGNGDGKLDRAELEARDIGDYDPGNEDVNDLWSWLVAQTRTLGHVDGEGHCEAAATN
jgi:hypothetical protein